MHRLAPALPLAATVAGLALAATACSADSEPSASPSEQQSSASVDGESLTSLASSAAPTEPFVDRIPEALRRDLFTQDAVPPSYADWISVSPGQTTVDGRREVQVERRLPACDKPVVPLRSDKHTAGFAERLFQDGDFVVTRQLTIYHSEQEAAAAVDEMMHTALTCGRYDGKEVTGSSYQDLAGPPSVWDLPEHDQTVAGELSLSVGGGPGAAWWTVVAREDNAVVLTRVVDPQAQVSSDGTTADSDAFTQEVVEQAGTSAKALDSF